MAGVAFGVLTHTLKHKELARARISLTCARAQAAAWTEVNLCLCARGGCAFKCVYRCVCVRILPSLRRVHMFICLYLCEHVLLTCERLVGILER